MQSMDVPTIDVGDDSFSDTLKTSEQVSENDAASTEIHDGSSIVSEEPPVFNVDTSSNPSNALLADTVLGLMINVGKVLEYRYDNDYKMLRTDRKLRRMIRRKKMELGKTAVYCKHQIDLIFERLLLQMFKQYLHLIKGIDLLLLLLSGLVFQNPEQKSIGASVCVKGHRRHALRVKLFDESGLVQRNLRRIHLAHNVQRQYRHQEHGQYTGKDTSNEKQQLPPSLFVRHKL